MNLMISWEFEHFAEVAFLERKKNVTKEGYFCISDKNMDLSIKSMSLSLLKCFPATLLSTRYPYTTCVYRNFFRGGGDRVITKKNN